MESAITKDILQHKLYSGIRPAMELLYGRYGGMLFSFVLQFIPDRKEAEELLVDIFSAITTRLQEACQSPLSVYCWMQVEARKVILEYARQEWHGQERHGQEGPDTSIMPSGSLAADIRQFPSSYLTLLRRATEEQQWVFRELFLKGREREELARQLSRDKAYIDKLLGESLVIIRAHMI